MLLIKSDVIFDGKQFLYDHGIVVDGGKIIDILPLTELSTKDILIRDYGDQIISPGFIDLQLNGCGGVLFNDDISIDSLQVMYDTCLRYGTTNFLPTLISCDFSDVKQALQVIKHWFDLYGFDRGVIGLHLEGPFISVNKKGIHDDKFIVPPDEDLLQLIISYRKFFPIKLTIAPELFTDRQIKMLVDGRIILSIGHSDADCETAKKSFSLGVKTTTHMFNAMSGLTARNPGVIAASFLSGRDSYSGVIADGLHVDYANLHLLFKLKPNSVYLVTDAVTPMGTNQTEFTLAGKHIYVKNGKCLDEEGTLGGAYLTLPEALLNITKNVGVKLSDALSMVTSIPAQVIGCDDMLGYIAPGYYANLIVINPVDFACNIITG